ncbi:hypothetical protein CLV86_0148 [Lacinutrix venerupis]|uniref:hypothetical protein n=1 Tax=Lacinutrix venerupis TaxID=1486034 RepID=UPI000F292855|nr:hypothetical protein [Lacinutrix venerupis]RLJ68759.1 hypothetical protein CLV86_0148 [Lacinutrix venerupis]
MKKKLPVFLIVASAILIVFEIASTDIIDKSFWLSIFSSVLVIISMVLTLKNHKRKDNQ